MGPEHCKKCGQLQKPSFTEWFCPRCTTLEKEAYSCPHGINTKNKACKDCLENVLSVQAGYGLDLKTQAPWIDGVQMTHWFKCNVCNEPAFYLDHKPIDAEMICRSNGYYQKNKNIEKYTHIKCDSCSRPMISFLPKNVNKY